MTLTPSNRFSSFTWAKTRPNVANTLWVTSSSNLISCQLSVVSRQLSVKTANELNDHPSERRSIDPRQKMLTHRD
jgi:hypothetical protein